jgi:hypothetical protein
MGSSTTLKASLKDDKPETKSSVIMTITFILLLLLSAVIIVVIAVIVIDIDGTTSASLYSWY